MRLALAFALAKAGSNSAARMAMMAITTRSSINVKALFIFQKPLWLVEDKNNIFTIFAMTGLNCLSEAIRNAKRGPLSVCLMQSCPGIHTGKQFTDDQDISGPLRCATAHATSRRHGANEP